MNYDALIAAIAEVHAQSLRGAAGAVNRHLILRNWIIGAYLVEFEQNGADRAKYGDALLKRLAEDLKCREVGGLGVSMLKDCRTFYRLYPQIRQPAVGELAAGAFLRIDQPLVGESVSDQSSTTSWRQSVEPTPSLLPVAMLFRLSWTHLIELIRIPDPWKRAFYENECLKGNCSKRQLQRQIGSLLYERTGLSTDKKAVIELTPFLCPGQIALEFGRVVGTFDAAVGQKLFELLAGHPGPFDRFPDGQQSPGIERQSQFFLQFSLDFRSRQMHCLHRFIRNFKHQRHADKLPQARKDTRFQWGRARVSAEGGQMSREQKTTNQLQWGRACGARKESTEHSVSWRFTKSSKERFHKPKTQLETKL